MWICIKLVLKIVFNEYTGLTLINPVNRKQIKILNSIEQRYVENNFIMDYCTNCSIYSTIDDFTIDFRTNRIFL